MDRLEKNNIVKEVKDSFLEYSMSVIVSRAYTDTDFDYKYQRFYNALSDYIIEQISNKQRFFANKIYKELENLYYNCYSDEHVREWFKNCCDSVFLENGKEFEM